MTINEEEKLKNYMKDNSISGDHIRSDKSLHSVQDLISALGIDLELITKSIIFKGKEKPIVALVPAKFRASSKRVGKVLGIEPPEIATPEEAYELTGYPAGGMPFFGYDATLIVDPKVFDVDYVYTGGGSSFSVVKINTEEIRKFNPIVEKITGKKSN